MLILRMPGKTYRWHCRRTYKLMCMVRWNLWRWDCCPSPSSMALQDRNTGTRTTRHGGMRLVAARAGKRAPCRGRRHCCAGHRTWRTRRFGMRHNFLVTGASGFVGKSLCAELLRRGYAIRAAVRSGNARIDNVEQAIVGSIGGGTDWSAALRGVDVVIHLAARVHVMRETAGDPLAEFLEVNLHGTENLARQAARAGIKRLVYISSIKVNGEGCPHPLPLSHGERGERVYRESDAPNPQGPYAVSKWQAEQALRQVAQETGLEVVIVRLPLVYGPGVKGNFIRLLKVVDKGIPMPLAGVRNKRSLIYLGNLVDALIICASHPAAAGRTYLVSDGEDIPTPELIRRLVRAMGHPAGLFPLPPGLLKLGGRLLGKAGQVARLLGSLRVDTEKIRRELDWQPPYSMQQGLQATADWYRHHPG